MVATAALAALAAAGLTPESRITSAGLGPVRAGMALSEAQRAAGMALEGPSTPRSCRYLRPADRDVRALFMVVGFRIARVDVRHRGLRTPSGVQVGDSERAVRRRFAGRLTITPHKYVEGGRYLEFRPRDAAEARRRIVFETDGRRVTLIRAGRLPEARWVEGCS